MVAPEAPPPPPLPRDAAPPSTAAAAKNGAADGNAALRLMLWSAQDGNAELVEGSIVGMGGVLLSAHLARKERIGFLIT